MNYTDMPKCDFCSNTAATFLKQVINGEEKTMNICVECMEKQGIDIQVPETILKAFDHNPQEFKNEQLEVKCDCGNTGEDMVRGIAGCEKCYENFRDLLDAVWRLDLEHPIIHIPQTEQEELEGLLEDAVSEENYEEAALIRDRIKVLEKKDASKQPLG